MTRSKCLISAAVSVASLAALPGMVLGQEVTRSGVREISGGAVAAILAGRGLRPTFLPDPYTEVAAETLEVSSLAKVFKSMLYGHNHGENGFRIIPPDPIGAAGPEHLVAVVNSMIEIRTKEGELIRRESLENFFQAQDTPIDEGIFPFDPKVIYDRFRNRFLVVAMELSEVRQLSRILLAVSRDSTPTGVGSPHWHVQKIWVKLTIDGEGFFADYPGFEVDDQAVYITANVFNFAFTVDGGSRVWIVEKDDFYRGDPAVVRRYNPYATAGFPFVTTMPAEVVGSGLDGTFLVAYEGLTDGTDEYVQVIRIRSPLSGPAFNHRFVSVGDIEDFDTIALPDAPQKGSSVGIEVNDRRALDAVWWNNELWFTTTIDPAAGPNAGEATAHWFKFHAPNSGGVTLADQGDIGGEDIAPNTSTFFPAITMNSEGHVKFGFSASAPSIYAGAYATGRLHHDPPGTVRASETLKAGLAPYFRTHGGSRNRWGDYSGISLDPTDDNWVWVFNEYAETRGGPSSDPTENGRWGTAWGLGKFE